jgi:hypothetical protein
LEKYLHNRISNSRKKAQKAQKISRKDGIAATDVAKAMSVKKERREHKKETANGREERSQPQMGADLRR